MTKICPVCNNTFTGKSLYCSKKCQHMSMRTYNYDINNPPRCKFCNDVLEHRKANKGYIFCCHKCRISYTKQLQENYINGVGTKQSTCQICGNKLTYSQIKRNVKTCSPKCSYELRVILYGAVSECNPDKFVQYAIINELRHDKELRKKQSDSAKQMWQNPDFRQNMIERMKIHNPSYNPEIVKKSIKTREQNNTLHILKGTQGGNGCISFCEQLLYDFCIDNDFVYNKAINTSSLRKQYPEKHLGFNYKPDFTNFKYKLCIEIDGKSHNGTRGKQFDSKKEFCLNCLGYKLLRFKNEEVIYDLENVKLLILTTLQEMRESNG